MVPTWARSTQVEVEQSAAHKEDNKNEKHTSHLSLDRGWSRNMTNYKIKKVVKNLALCSVH